LIEHDSTLLEQVDVAYELSSTGITVSRGGWYDWLESRDQLLLGAQRDAA
jgi:hypothetical protein